MAEAFPASATVLALNGTSDGTTGLPYVSKGVGPSSSPTIQEQIDRLWHRLNLILAPYEGLRFHREVSSGLTYGVKAGLYILGGAVKSFAAVTAQTLTNNATNYIYVNSSNALVVSTSSYPADITTFHHVATVVTSGGDVTTVTDTRGYNVRSVLQTTSASDSGTNNTTFILDEDNAGAGADCQLRANRGSTDAEDAAIQWDETNDKWRFRKQHTTDTLCAIDTTEVQISGASALTTDGAAKVQSAVAGNGLSHSAGVLTVATASANGTSIATDIVTVDPSDGIAVDANGVRVNATANGGLEFAGTAGSQTVGVNTDDSTVELSAGGAVQVKSGGLTPIKTANYAAANGAIEVLFSATLVAGNTVSIFTANAPFKFKVIDAWSIAQSADAGTWKVDDGTNAITDTVAVTATDQTINRAGKIDDARYTILASGSLRVVGDGALADVEVFVKVIRAA
jgi:hypothetical protein